MCDLNKQRLFRQFFLHLSLCVSQPDAEAQIQDAEAQKINKYWIFKRNSELEG